MGSGLSMASVNKIKELAEQREYSLALDIVDSQDLSKSLNPQFLRVCGEIYINNERYKDARKVLLMAHKLAPEGKRVIYSLTYLYLKMGYEKLAEKYYNLYLFDADEFNPETNQIKYIYNKANKCEPEELEEFLCPQYIHNLDYDWSFEAFLLLALLDKKQEMKVLASDFIATYKNSEYSKCIENIMNGKASAEDYYYVFPEEKRADDDPEQEELRQEEKILLKADDLRVNPRDAEITIMVDDFEEVDIGTQRRLKKFLKNEEKAKKKEKKKEKELSEDSEGEGNDSEETELKSLSDGENQENAATEEAASEEDSKEDADKEVSEDAESEDAPVEKKKVKGLFKKVFSKKKKQSDELEEDAEETEETDQVSETEKTESEDNNQEEKTEETPDNESEEASVEHEKADTDVSEDESSDEVSGTEGQMVDTSVDVAEDSPKEEEEVLMREIHTNKHNPKVSIDFDDNDFAAESDTIEGLKDEDFSNPFDSISAFKKEKEEPAFVPKRKTEFSFDDIDLSTDEDEEFEVDDFSSDEDEFGKMEVALEDSEGYTEEYTEAEPEEEEIVEEFEEEVEVEPEVEVEETYEEEYAEESTEEYTEDYAEENTEAEPEEEEIEEESEVEEVEVEPEVEVEETYEEEYAEESTEEYTEDYAEENIEAEPEEEEIEEESEVEEVEVETEVEVEVEETYAEEYAEESTEEYTEDYAEENTEAEPEEEEIEEIKEEIQEEPEVRNDYIPEPQKKKLDYPVFRSSLFPNHNKEVKQVENNFNEIMTKGQDKIQENLLKEEQMQREAEALLASLGIDLSSITVTSDSIDSINATLYNEPSRDELKASLKIDSVKKNILKQLKEYR